jgi:sporulation protein YlmC with PRC-barrel domain
MVDFDRLRLTAPVFLSYDKMKVTTSSKAYEIGFKDSEIAEFYPSLLSQVETAAGGNEDEVSLKKIIGNPVITTDGRGIGTVNDILFSANGDRASAVYISLNTGILSGKSVAVPFSAVSFSSDGFKPTAIVANDMADAMIDFASKH